MTLQSVMLLGYLQTRTGYKAHLCG